MVLRGAEVETDVDFVGLTTASAISDDETDVNTGSDAGTEAGATRR